MEGNDEVSCNCLSFQGRRNVVLLFFLVVVAALLVLLKPLPPRLSIIMVFLLTQKLNLHILNISLIHSTSDYGIRIKMQEPIREGHSC